jgi:hypothetical protein
MGRCGDGGDGGDGRETREIDDVLRAVHGQFYRSFRGLFYLAR